MGQINVRSRRQIPLTTSESTVKTIPPTSVDAFLIDDRRGAQIRTIIKRFIHLIINQLEIGLAVSTVFVKVAS